MFLVVMFRAVFGEPYCLAGCELQLHCLYHVVMVSEINDNDDDGGGGGGGGCCRAVCQYSLLDMTGHRLGQ